MAVNRRAALQTDRKANRVRYRRTARLSQVRSLSRTCPAAMVEGTFIVDATLRVAPLAAVATSRPRNAPYLAGWSRLARQGRQPRIGPEASLTHLLHHHLSKMGLTLRSRQPSKIRKSPGRAAVVARRHATRGIRSATLQRLLAIERYPHPCAETKGKGKAPGNDPG